MADDVFRCDKCRHTWIGFGVTECQQCTPVALPVIRTRPGQSKVDICRSNACGHYDAEHDACGILRDRGKAGKVTYLLMRPQTRCVADDPLF